MSDGHAETVNVDELEGYLERTGQNKPIEVREACRRRMPLDGTDAMHLEHALQITERERDEAMGRIAELEALKLFQTRMTTAYIRNRDYWRSEAKKENTMLDVYLYGASDDCREIETSDEELVTVPMRHESYGDIRIEWKHNMGDIGSVLAHYVFDGDWGVQIQGDIPVDWRVKGIDANTASELRGKENAGQFVHMRIPDHYQLKFVDAEEADDAS